MYQQCVSLSAFLCLLCINAGAAVFAGSPSDLHVLFNACRTVAFLLTLVVKLDIYIEACRTVAFLVTLGIRRWLLLLTHPLSFSPQHIAHCLATDSLKVFATFFYNCQSLFACSIDSLWNVLSLGSVNQQARLY